MLSVLGNTILPVFSIILLGYALKIKGIIQTEFIKPANQIVFYVAIPVMIFNTIAQAAFRANFHPAAGLCILGALAAVVLLGAGLSRVLRIPEERRGTFLQSSFHGNIGYMAYAIAFYALGENHFARTAILSSFLLIGQNFAAVWTLTATSTNSENGRQNFLGVFRLTIQNPVILAAILGVLYSASGFPLPRVVSQSLTILSGMALPTALLLIGASLSFGAFRSMQKEVLTIGLLKLVCLPLVGFMLMQLTRVPDTLLLPGLILLASPPATVTYVMAIQMGGDPELAAASVSTLTLASALTYSIFIAAFM